MRPWQASGYEVLFNLLPLQVTLFILSFNIFVEHFLGAVQGAGINSE